MAPFRGFLRRLLLLNGALLGCQESPIVEPNLGTIQVTTAWTGDEPDPDGYAVQVDGEPSQPIGVTATLHADDVAGEHSVQLTGVAGNCAVEGENPRPVRIVANDTTRVDFIVTCNSTLGSVLVVSSTTGSFPDPDGYRITIDLLDRGAIAANGKLSVTALRPTEHQVTLSDVASNCLVAGDTTRMSQVLSRAVDTVEFKIDCANAPPIAFESGGHIFLVNSDGSGSRNLAPDESGIYYFKWSPDGNKIVFSKGGQIWTVNSDGSGRSKLTSAEEVAYDPHWSADGSRIAFVQDTVVLTPEGVPDESCDGLCYVPQVWVVAVDGSNARVLAFGTSPSWSPDGRRIAISSGPPRESNQIWVVNVDGGGLTRLTSLPNGAGGAQWSPDGERLAFAAYSESYDPDRYPPQKRDIFIINPDGSDLVNLTQGRVDHDGPRWSPDGSKIAFTGYTNADGLNSEIGVINRDGTGEINLTNNVASDFNPDWSPDGTALVFVRYTFPTAPEAYVMKSDGSQQIKLSKGGASNPIWSPRR
jgi:Tol biopolymer transport system component